MADDDELDDLAAAVIALAPSVGEHGSPEVRIAYRVLLMALGRQIVRGASPRDDADRTNLD